MNDLTQTLLESAFEYMKANGQKPEARRLFERLATEWTHYRDGQLEMRAQQILDQMPADRLIALAPCVFDAMNDHGEWLMHDLPEDDDDMAFCAALGLASLRWMKREANGLIPLTDATMADIETWLERRLHPQMRMF